MSQLILMGRFNLYVLRSYPRRRRLICTMILRNVVNELPSVFGSYSEEQFVSIADEYDG